MPTIEEEILALKKELERPMGVKEWPPSIPFLKRLIGDWEKKTRALERAIRIVSTGQDEYFECLQCEEIDGIAREALGEK